MSLFVGVWYIVWSIADFADCNGFVMVSNNFGAGRGAAGGGLASALQDRAPAQVAEAGELRRCARALAASLTLTLSRSVALPLRRCADCSGEARQVPHRRQPAPGCLGKRVG